MSAELGQEFIDAPLLEGITKPLEGKTAVISGAGRKNGIGFAIAERFAAEGAKSIALLAYSYDPQGWEQLEQRLDRYGTFAKVFQCDVTREADVSMAMQIAYTYCGLNIDILVNNAGTNLRKPFLETTAEDWDYVVDAKEKGTFLLSREWFKVRNDENIRGGRVINIGSVIGGSHGLHGNEPYAAGNAAVLYGLTRSFALDMGRMGVNVNGIAPTFIPGTEMTAGMDDMVDFVSAVTPLRANRNNGVTTLPQDIAGVALFLAGPDSAKMSGQIITVDGGMDSNFTAAAGLHQAGYRKLSREAASLGELSPEEIKMIKADRKAREK